MRQLATAIREQLDPLVDRYDAQLCTRPGYTSLPEAMRRDLERRFLNLIAESLDAGDYSQLVQYAQQRASQWAARGLNLVWFQQALTVPEELLVPLVRSVEAGNFVWQALNRGQNVVWQMVANQAHQTEERFRSIVETSHSGILIADDAFHLSYVNDEVAQISGYTREELLSTDFRQLFDEESRRAVLDHYLRRQQGEAVAPRYEVAFLHKDGTKRHLEMSAVSLQDLNGKPYTVAQVLDVSERKQAEQALRASEAQYQTIFDSTPIMFWLKDAHNFTLRVNKAAALFEGVQPADIEGKSCYDVYPAEQAEAFYQDDLQVIRSGEPKLGIVEQHTSVGTGQLMWVETGKVPIRDEHGAITGVLAFAVDITARREAEEALAREHNLLRTLIDTLPDQVFVKDTQGRIILYNQADARAMQVATTEEALGKTVYDLYPRELADEYYADDMAVIQSDRPMHDREELGLNEDGSRRWVLTTKVPLKDQAGRSVGLVGIARDITRRKQIESTLQESEERFRRFSEATSEGLVFHDKGVILDANPAIVTLFGFATAAELIGRNLLEFIVPEARPLVLQKMQLDDVHPYEVQATRKDGFTFPIETSTRVYQYGEQTIRATAVRDITERKRAETTLRENESRLRAIYEGSTDAIMLLNAQGFFDCNAQTLKLFGVDSKEEFIRLHPSNLSPAHQPDGQDSLSASLRNIELAYQQGHNRFEWVHRRLNGEDFPAEVLLSAFEYGGEQVLQATVRDITERKLAEKALAQSVEKQQKLTQRLRATIEATDELMRASDLDTLYRRAVELAREKIGVERCGLFIVDPTRQFMLGTYGTDIQGQTTDERALRDSVDDHPTLFISPEKTWVVQEALHQNWISGERQALSTGWVGGTVIRSASGPIGVMYNDAAIGQTPPDPDVQETLAVYCSELGNVIERKRLELQIRESLTRRSTQVQTSTEVAQDIAAAPALDELFRRVVTLIKERFNYYHAQIFRLEPTQDAVVLITGYGDVGRKMLAAGHQLKMGRGVVGTAAATGRSILAPDVAQSTQWQSNPNLPNTQGELAVPIKLRDQVLGILDVQSDQVGTLTQEDQLLLEGLCGQIAIALDYRQAEDRLAEEGRFIRTLIDTIPDLIYAKNLESQFILANTATAQRMGAANPAELIGKSDSDYYPRELAAKFRNDEQPILQEGQSSFDYEEPVVDADLQRRWHSSTKVPLRDNQDRIIGLIGVTRDITATKLAEAEREQLLAVQNRRALQLQTASEVSRAASSILNVDELLPQLAELIRARFGFYYVGIFLMDEAKRWAILQAGTGSAGQQMLANKHQLEVGGNSMIGQCIVTQRAQIALDVGEEAVHFDNPLLPLTHSEIALPLISRGRIIGAMTIQSDQAAAFTAADITVLQSMADQISNAVENARLYEQAQAALADTDSLLRASAELNVSQSYEDVLAVLREHTTLGRDALSIAINVFDRPWTVHQTPQWIELIGYSTRRATGMEIGTRFPLAMFASARTLLRADAPTLLEDLSLPEVDANTRALFAQRLGAKSVIFVPLVVGGQWVGYINLLFAETTHFHEAEVRRLEALVGQAGVAVQNMRNLAGAQQALTETDASYRATQAIGRAQSIESILEAATPVVQLMGMTRAALRMITRRDLNGVIAANDYYAYHWLDDRWVLQPMLKDAAVNDFAALKPLVRNPEEVMLYKDAQNPNSLMPEDVRRTLTANGLRSAVATSINVQNEVIGFLVFSGPQALADVAEQRIRLTVGTLSDQIAVAVQNRQLFEQTRAALQEVDAVNRRLTGEAWESYLRQQAGREVIWAADDETTTPDTLAQLDDQLAAGEITIEPDPENRSEAIVTAPILLRGEAIGALRLRTPLDEWNEDTQLLLADITNHIAQAVENARLVEQTQRTAQRERTINEINARVRQSVDLDAILHTAVNELGQSLKAARVVARVGTLTTEGTTPGDGRGKTND